MENDNENNISKEKTKTKVKRRTHGIRLDIVEVKLDELKNKYDEINNFFRHHLQIITIILAIAGALISYLSFSAKQEVKEAIKEMETKFEKLSDKALRNPNLEIFYSQKHLDGQLLNLQFKNNERFNPSFNFHIFDFRSEECHKRTV